MTPQEKRLTQARVAVLGSTDWGFLGSVIMTGPTTISTGHGPTAATDGWNTWFHPDFIDDHTDQELAFVVIHEALHKAFRHMQTAWRTLLRPYDPRLANYAMDYVINAEIIGCPGTHPGTGHPLTDMPRMGLYNPKYTGWDTVRVYKDLLENPPPDGSGTLDEHIHTEEGEGEGEGAPRPAPTAEQRAEMEAAIAQAIAAGNGLSPMSRTLAAHLTPKVDWRALLRGEWAARVPGREAPNWNRPHAAYRNLGLYYPASVATSPACVTVCVDMSGSVGQVELDAMLAEVEGLATTTPPGELRLVWWHSAIEGEDPISPSDYAHLRQVANPRGCGGTEPDVLRPHLGARLHSEEHTVVILTDGYFNRCDLGANVVWVITPGGTTSNITNGTIIEM